MGKTKCEENEEYRGLPTDETFINLDAHFAKTLSEEDGELFWSLSGIERYVVRRGDLTLKDIRNYRKRNY